MSTIYHNITKGILNITEPFELLDSYSSGDNICYSTTSFGYLNSISEEKIEEIINELSLRKESDIFHEDYFSSP